LVAERHRVALAHPTIRDSLGRHMDDLQHLIHATDEEVATIIRTSPAWREKDDL
jgi:transposase